MPDLEQVVFEIDESRAISAQNRINGGMDATEKKIVGAMGSANKAIEQHGDTVIRINDRSRNSVDRLVASYEKQSALYGKSGVEKEIAQRDQLISRLGNEEAAIKRVTAAAAERIKVLQAAEGASGNFTNYGIRLLKDIGEGKTPNAGAELVNIFDQLKGAPMVVGAITASLGLLAGASFEAAKSLGTYAASIKDIESSTGLGAKQVSEFSFAAKAVGQDISIVERSMRGLTMAIEDDSAAGDKARDVLRGYGVDIAGLKDGTVSTYDLFMKLSDGINANTTTWKQNKDALDLLRRAGIEDISFFKELRENSEYFQSHHLPAPGETEIDAWKRYLREVSAFDVEWDDFKRRFVEQPLVSVGGAVAGGAEGLKAEINLLQTLSSTVLGSKPGPNDYNMAAGSPLLTQINRSREEGDQAATEAALARWGRTKEGLEKALGVAKTNEEQALEKLKNLDRSGIQDLNKAESDITRLTKSLKDLAAASKDVDLTSLAKKAAGIGESALAKYQQEYAPLLGGNATQRQAYQTGITQLFEKGLEDSEKKRLEQEQKNTKESIDLQALLERTNESITAGVSEENRKQAELTRHGAMQGFSALVGGPPGPNAKDIQERTQSQLRGDIEAAKLSPGAQPGTIASLNLAARKQAADYELSAALEKAKVEKDSVSAEYDARYQYETKLQEARRDFENELLELQKKQFDEIANTSSGLFHTLFTKPQDFGKQFGSTLHEAMLKPIDEGLGQMTARLVRPLVYGESGTGGIAGMFHGAFGGNSGTSRTPSFGSIFTNGASAPNSNGYFGTGIPGGAQNNPLVPLVIETNALLRVITGELSAGLGTSLPTVVSSSGSGSSMSVSVTKNSPPSFGSIFTNGASAPNSNGYFGTGSVPDVSSTISYGDTSDVLAGGYSPSIGGGGYSPSIGGGGVSYSPSALPQFLQKAVMGGGAARLPGSGGSGGSMMSILGKLGSNAKGLAGFGNITTDSQGGHWATVGNQSINIDTLGGKVQAAASSPLAGAAGMGLAQAGLFGQNRGTGKGILESTAGGALIGMQYGGPVGAAVGATVGLVAGVAENLLGDISPRQKAKQYAQQIYHISISNQEADQIVSIANSKYGGNVRVAVASPEVRQMLAIYSAGTGQKNFPLSASMPHAGSLEEQNGSLYQVANYQFGNPQTFASNLPVAGGASGATIPNPGGPTYLSLNIGPDSAASFMTGSYVTPDFVQSQYSASQGSSINRVANSAQVQQPGLIVS